MGRIWWYLSPWGLAYAIFRSRSVYQHDDELIEAWNFWRRLLSLALFVGLVWRLDPTAFGSAPEVAVFNVAQGAAWTVLVVLALCAVMPFLVRGGNRLLAIRAGLRPGARLLMFAAVIYLTVRVGVVEYEGGRFGNTTTLNVEDPWFIPKTIGFLLGAVWVVIFLVVSMYFAAAGQLGIGDAHPALEPVAAVAVAWTLFLGTRVGFLQDLTWGPDDASVFPRPPELVAENGWSLPVTIIGLIGLTLLAAVEFGRANARHPLLAGPWR